MLPLETKKNIIPLLLLLFALKLVIEKEKKPYQSVQRTKLSA